MENKDGMVQVTFEPGEPAVVFHRGAEYKEKLLERARNTGLWNIGSPSEYGFCALCTEHMIDDLRGRVFEDFLIICPRCAEKYKSANNRSLALDAGEMYCEAALPPALEFKPEGE